VVGLLVVVVVMTVVVVMVPTPGCNSSLAFVAVSYDLDYTKWQM
jgi:hypothetical protein